MNLSNSSITTPVSTECPYQQPEFIIDMYFIPIISGIGILTNFPCVVVFAKMIRDGAKAKHASGHIFKYLLCKAVFDLVQSVRSVFSALYFCTTCSSYGTLAAQIWYVWFYTYLSFITSLGSAMFEVAATFDCLITINQKMPYCRKTFYFVLIFLAIVAFNALFYLFKLFEFTIVKYPKDNHEHYGQSNSSSTGGFSYFFEYTSFHNSPTDTALKTNHGFLRDVVCLILIVILNVLILISVRKRTETEKRFGRIVTDSAAMQSQTVVKSPTRNPTERALVVETASRADRVAAKATKMAIMIGVNYFFGHVLMFVYYIVLIKPSVFKSCMYDFAIAVMFISVDTPLFIYLIFNRNFKTRFLEIFMRRKTSAEQKT